ncbi:MAG: succinate dehydrogenase iron-sulfur subunit [Candidatus Thermoplasmatota archaeon]|jgi:succinate dehydrogenase / fumarate reductase iron-sulfur subunit|nr:succinate dehydrogenase iron-sulfur subunit [Candidatus Thermoplasmatota archaeon]MCL5681348.1 succinate dehydrogenase iron-sulfur subunit [Candidatus Thermoplasmatota archaeon]
MELMLKGFGEVVKTVTLRVRRYDPEKKELPKYMEYKVPVQRGMTVLDGILYIKEHIDPSLAARYSCRMGICGSCAMIINNRERLACQTQILDLGKDLIKVDPMGNYDLVKDLVPDLTKLFRNHESIKPYIIRQEEKVTGEFLQLPEERELYSMFTECIMCGACLSACPTMATDELYLGPQALAQSFRYIADSRDIGFNERLNLLDSKHGVWRCHFAGACSDVCPKGIDPALAIQLLKGMLAKNVFVKYQQKPAKIGPDRKSILETAQS